MGLSNMHLLRDVAWESPPGTYSKATKDLAEEAEIGSFWHWLGRKDKT